MFMMRALISALGTPQKPNIRSLDFCKGVLGKTVLMMLFGGRPGAPEILSCGGDFVRASPRAPGEERRSVKRGRHHGRLPHSKARAVAFGSNVGRCPI